MDKEQAAAPVAGLMQRYKALTSAQRRSYNEEETKKDFILPLFRALGWNTEDSSQVAAEVAVGSRRADYAFRTRGVTRFTLEAKALEHAFTPQDFTQAIRYAYHQSTRWAILTNFRELHVFYADRQVRDPLLARAGLPQFTATDYLTRLDSLLLLSPQSFTDGRFEEAAKQSGALPPQLAPVDRLLFASLRDWRERLFTQLYQAHADRLNLLQIDEVILRLFNRLIFIRSAEDRSLEDPALTPLLRQDARRSGLLAGLHRVFNRFEAAYDSELFQSALLDDLFASRGLDIVQDIVAEIIEGLHGVPGGFFDYDFSRIDADVMGRVYEQYLGHVAKVASERIEIARQRQLPGLAPEIIELAEKRAKRKSGGIYYTPQWVVDYIVRRTLGPALKARKDHGRPLRVLDPACGSGSFLIRALDALVEDEARFTHNDLRALDTRQRAALLRQSLFGVDLDPQAVEIARQRQLPGLAPEIIELAEKRAKRKSGGIYYTPRWVVDYIVRRTLGPALKARKDHGRPLRILDPACGSGSFLIRALDALVEDEARFTHNDLRTIDTHQRAALLRQSLFGVDLDPQAVEIARLNLMLRALAGRDRLPELRENVRRGNALIPPDEDVLIGWDPLDWQAAFPWLADEGGFDVIIGNPPYVRIQSLDRQQADWFRGHYESAFGSFDLYVLFLERALQLLKSGGRAGFITSGKFLKAAYGARLQRLLLREATVEEIVDLSAVQVFADATTYPVILVLQKKARPAHGDPVEPHERAAAGSPAHALRQAQGEREITRPLRYTRIPAEADLPNREFDPLSLAGRAIEVPQAALAEGVWPPQPRRGQGLWQKVHAAGPQLGDLADKIFQGWVTSADRIYLLEVVSEKPGLITVRTPLDRSTHNLEPDCLWPILRGSSYVYRYRIVPPTMRILFPYAQSNGDWRLVEPDTFRRTCPKTWDYLNQYRSNLEARENNRMKHNQWYAYVYPKNLGDMSKPKIMATSMAQEASFALDATGRYAFTGGGSSGVYGITLKSGQPISALYLLALLNSSTLEYILRRLSSVFRGGYFVQRPQYLKRLPIALPDPSRGSDKQRHDALAALAGQAIATYARIAEKGGLHDSERQDLEDQAARLDRQIDDLVYDLYGLTQAERRLIEQGVPRAARP